MTRIDSVRTATGSAKESVRHAAEVVAPYAGTAKDQARQYAHEARVRLAPKVASATQQARSTALDQYGTHLQPRLEQARGALPPKVDAAAHQAARGTRKAARRTRKAARQAADYALPRVEHTVADARAAAGPVRDEAATRSAAALAALRGQVTPAEIEKLVRKRNRRARTGRMAKRVVVLGVLAGGAFAAWKWWTRQTSPEWLVEPPAATEVGGRTPLTSVDGSSGAALDPEVEAKQAEAEAESADRRDEQR